MNGESNFESRLTAALERRESAAVPAGFSARVAAALPRRPAARRTRHLGRNIAVALGALSLVAMLVIAPHSSASYANLPFDAEFLLLAELAGITGWLSLHWREV